jgi:hypothetical protein
MAKTFRAVYKDAQDRLYSCPVQIHDGQWVLVTTSGFAPITHTLDNQEYGVVTFDSYREEADTRLHIEPRQPGQSSFRQLQEARATHINQERKEREEARARAQQTVVNPAKIAQARSINEEFARMKRPNGRGIGLVIGEKE